MKTKNIFLASSEELDYDRLVIGNLVRRLDALYEKRGVRIRLFEWEDYDAAYNDSRKQDEYNDMVRKSDVFLALFYKKAGEFTLEEFENAVDEFKAKSSPKVYIFMKALGEGEKASDELSAFKKRIRETMGYYWCRYDTKESLQFQIVMQLSLIEDTLSDEFKVEDGQITLQGIKVATFDHLSFAAGNEEYTKLCVEHSLLPEKIAKARLRAEKFPDDEDLLQDLQQKLDRYNDLKEQIEKIQTILFNSAKRIAKLQGEKVTERMRRAMDAFMDGNVREANIILDEAEKDADAAIEEYRRSKELHKEKRNNVEISIGELRLKASTLAPDLSIPAYERVKLIEDQYRKAESLAQEIGLEGAEYVDILYEHAKFLYENFDSLDELLQIARLLVNTAERHFGKSNLKTADAYNTLGMVYDLHGQNACALSYYRKTLRIRKRLLGENNFDTAKCYHNIGMSFMDLAQYDKAISYMIKAADIFKSDKENADLATCYDGIGNALYLAEKPEEAMGYLQKALGIRLRVRGEKHQDTAYSYNNIGVLLQDSKRFDEAYEYHKRALDIERLLFGENSPNTAVSYNNLATLFLEKTNYDEALRYSLLDLNITLKAYGPYNPEAATAYCNTACIYHEMDNYKKAEEYYQKALSIRLGTLSENHPDVATSYNNLGSLYDDMEEYSKALEYSRKALQIREKILRGGASVMKSLENIASIYQHMKEYDKALEYFGRAMDLAIRSFGENSHDAAFSYECLGSVYHDMGPLDKSLEFYFKALDIYERELGSEEEETLLCYFTIAEVYEDMKDDEKAAEYFRKAKVGTVS